MLAEGNIAIVKVAAFAMFGTRFQQNRIDFGAKLKQRLGGTASRRATFGDGKGILVYIVPDVFVSYLQKRGCGD